MLCCKCNGVLDEASSISDFGELAREEAALYRVFAPHVERCEGLWTKSDCEKFLLPRSSLLSDLDADRDRAVSHIKDNVVSTNEERECIVVDDHRPKRERKRRTDTAFDYCEDGDKNDALEGDDSPFADFEMEYSGDDKGKKKRRKLGSCKANSLQDAFEKQLGVLYTLSKTPDDRAFDFACRFCDYRTEFKGYMKKHFSLHGK